MECLLSFCVIFFPFLCVLLYFGKKKLRRLISGLGFLEFNLFGVSFMVNLIENQQFKHCLLLSCRNYFYNLKS
jgi:hypothetical protein